MSVLKVKKNGEWKNIINETKNADTLDGKHASDFVLNDDVIQISKGGTNATNGKDGLKNLLASGAMILSSNQYGDELPTSGEVGQLFFKKVSN